MQFFLRHRSLLIVFLVLVVGASVYAFTQRETVPDWVTGTITKGDVRELISVSGVLEASSKASLTFPVSGTVRDIFVTEGEVVMKDHILATLEQGELQADRRDAEAALMIAQADRTELISGPRAEERDVTASAVTIARANLAHTQTEEAQKVENAYRALLSSDLEARPLNPETSATPPEISGTYRCSDEGIYTITTFRSGSQSGYSYKVNGLEEGTYSAFTDAPGALGSCGLFIQFTEGDSYGNKTFEIEIPNRQSASYATLLNTYLLAQRSETNAVAAARESLTQAEREATLANALPREEEQSRADAKILQASARLAVIDARIRERTLIAPFAGLISNIDLTQGEVSTGKSLTLVASDLYELTVRIPEIDITRIGVGQEARVAFDARPLETIETTIGFISPTATEIDGVAYFEAKLRFTNPPQWFRSGLNADVDIIAEEVSDRLRVPERFVVTEGDATYLLSPQGAVTQKEKVEVTFRGNDGFAAIAGDWNEGDVIVAP